METTPYYLKYSVLRLVFLVLFSLCFVGCEKDSLDELESVEAQNPHYSISKISIEALSKDLSRDSHRDEVLSLFSPNDKNILNKNNERDFYLVKNNIVKITKEWGTSYTIQAIPKTESEGNFFNLVLFINPEGKLVKSHLVEYTPSSYDWLVDPTKPYEGDVKIVENHLINLDDLIKKGSLSGKCELVIDGGWTCSFGNSHAPGTCNASHFTYTLTFSKSCSSGGGGTSNHGNHSPNDNNWDGSSTGGGSGSGGGGNNEPAGLDDGNGITTTPIVVEDQIINRLTGKAKCVYDKMTTIDGNINWILENFDDKDKTSQSNLILEMSTELHNETNATTATPKQTGIANTFVIKINANTLSDRTSLGLARTIIHEGIHARLWEFVYRKEGRVFKSDFPGVYEYRRKYGYNWDHQQMAAHYRETIAKGLKQYDNAKHSDEFYDALAWEGLSQIKDQNGDQDRIYTEAWKKLSPTEQKKILQIITNEKQHGSKTCY